MTAIYDTLNNKRHGENIVSIGVWLSDKLFFKCFLILNYLLLKNVGQKTLCVIIVLQEEYGKTSCN